VKSPGRGNGQIMVLFALVLPVVLLMVGVTIDGSRLFQAHLTIQTLADEAADAGAQQVDVAASSSVRTDAPAELIGGRGPDSAFAAADAYLARRAGDGRTSWSIDVQRRAIIVTVRRPVDLAFMPIAGLRQEVVEARSVAAPLGGISEAMN
jgi:Flp pilus assembly protein TadG